MPDKRAILAEDIYRLQLVKDCQISPDGRWIAFCVQRNDKIKEKKYTNLWLVPTDGQEPRQLTFGDQSDTQPRWSPDGRCLAFLSDRADGDQDQIYILPLEGGEARPLTDLKGEFGDIRWSPDGEKLVMDFRKKDAEAIERDEDPEKKELGVVARHITRVFFKLDGTGYLPKERWHLWIVNAESGECRQLTDGAIFDENWPRWSPDGREIAFFSNRAEDPDLDPEAIDLFVIPAEGGQARQVETPVGYKYHLAYSQDGRWLAYFGTEGRGDWWKNDGLWIVPADGSAPARNLTGKYDVLAGNGTLGDIADRPTVDPVWSFDSRRLFFQLARHGNTRLSSISIDGDELQDLVAADGVVGTFSMDTAGTRIACNFGDATDPGQIWFYEIGSGEFGQLTWFNESLLAEIDLGQREEIWFKGPDGNDLQGWIIKPPGFDPAQTYPSILEIHGGPWLQYGNSFMHEFYYLAAQGYVVYYCNPRGGQGYGETHSKAIENNWGGPDYADLMAWADIMEKQAYIDPERMGVTGGSYGGYMTSWIIGHTDRFRAAAAQRVVSNLLSMWGSSDRNWNFQNAFGGQPPWENMKNYWRQSPMAHIGSATTPTLVIHSERDLRCDLEQGLQVFVALKRLGVDTELVLFPGEYHGLSRSGRADRRIARLQHLQRWFDRYLMD